MTDAVIFDLDGVIVDSEPVWERVRRRYVDTHGGRWQPDSQRRLMGMSTGEWSRYLSVELGVARTPEQVAAEVVEEMAEEYRVHVPLITGADRAVRRLAERWPLGLASSSPTRLIEAALAATGLTDAFRVTLSTELVQRGKPAPDVYLVVADRLGSPPRAASRSRTPPMAYGRPPRPECGCWPYRTRRTPSTRTPNSSLSESSRASSSSPRMR